MVHIRRHVCHLANSFFEHQIRPSPWKKCRTLARNFTTISGNHPETGNVFRSWKTISNERKRHVHSKDWFTIHPFSIFNYIWQIIMMIIYILVVTFDLLSVALVDTQFKEHPWIFRVKFYCIIVNTFSAIDVILHFFTGYIDLHSTTEFVYGEGLQKIKAFQIELQLKKIAIKYFRTFFIIDIFCFENIITKLMYCEPTFIDLHMIGFRLLRVARFYTAMKTAQMVFGQFTNARYTFNISFCGFTIVYCIFLFGCLHVAVPEMIILWTGKYRSCFPEKLKELYKSVGFELDPRVLLVHSMHDALSTLCGTGTMIYQHSIEGNILSHLNVLAGYILQAWFFVVIMLFLNTSWQSRLSYNNFLQDIRQYMASSQLHNIVQHNIMVYLNHTLKTEMFHEQDILETLEPRFRFELFATSSMDLIRKCHLFKDLSTDIVSSLAFRLKLETYLPGQKVIAVGGIASCMYFIASGSVAVYNRIGIEICHLYDGDYFGEIGLITLTTRRVASVLTIEDSELYRLDIKDFQEIVKPKSEMYARIRRSSLKRLGKKGLAYDFLNFTFT